MGCCAHKLHSKSKRAGEECGRYGAFKVGDVVYCSTHFKLHEKKSKSSDAVFPATCGLGPTPKGGSEKNNNNDKKKDYIQLTCD